MGHPDEIDDDHLAEAKRALGVSGSDRDGEIRSLLAESMREIEGIAGVRFGGGLRTARIDVLTGGMPFAYIKDLNLDEDHRDEPGTWAIPDPVQPMFARVLQAVAPTSIATDADPMWEALKAAALGVHLGLSRALFVEAVWRWLRGLPEVERLETLRAAADPGVSVMVPVFQGEARGWWIQATRRLILVHGGTPTDDPERVEVLRRGDGWVLVAAAPVIIVARTTEHPVAFAMPIRVWKSEGSRASHQWRTRQGPTAIRGYGVPVITGDDRTTADEAWAQLLLTAHWYGYLPAEETSVIPDVLAFAFPAAVRSIRSGCSDPDERAAATRLFERLLSRGFDPTCSAETMRRYVRRQATTIVLAHRAERRRDRPWTELGISESWYYKILRGWRWPKDADGRFQPLPPETREQLRRALSEHERQKQRHRDAMEFLIGRGYSHAAARKWLQRNPIEEIVDAWPRRGAA